VGGRGRTTWPAGGKPSNFSRASCGSYGVELLGFDWPLVAASGWTAGGGRTCARSPATWARALGVGGHLTELRRTRVGPFAPAGAVTPERLAAEGVAGHLAPSDFSETR
jgi:hypothetical protein